MSASTARRSGSRDIPAAVACRAAAKLNLSLAVLARRDDGFHEIESLVAPVTLHDTVEVRSAEEPGIRLRVRFAGGLATAAGSVLATDVPTDATNLVVRAARALAAAAGIAPDDGAGPGLEIDLVKRIPSGSGLGGGSSDAAAVIVAAARVWGIDWPRDRLAVIGGRIGSDVPVFFAGGAAIMGGRGERVEPVRGIPTLHAVIARPAAGLSTAAVYARCTPDPARRGDAARLAAALAAGRLRGAMPLMHNALQDAARGLCPEVGRLLDAFVGAGAAHPLLTGSGSACFALVRSATESRLVAARLRMAGWPGVYAVRFATAGRPA
jgi:4-diphosphocytidyl-2-C-methyl-D-erythritol kinase